MAARLPKHGWLALILWFLVGSLSGPWSSWAFAQPAAEAPSELAPGTTIPAPPTDQPSPRDVLLKFMDAVRTIQADDPAGWPRATACLNLAPLSIDPGSPQARVRVDALWRLLVILNQNDASRLPDALSLRDGATREILFPRPLNPTDSEVVFNSDWLASWSVAIEQTSPGVWRFDDRTVALADEMTVALRAHERLAQSLPSESIAEMASKEEALVPSLFPESMKIHQVFNLEYWQWVVLAIIIFLGVCLDFSLRLVLRGMLHGLFTHRKLTDELREVVTRTVRPAGLFASAMLWLLLLPQAALPPAGDAVLTGAARVFATLAGAWAGWRLVDLIAAILTDRAAKTQNKFDDVLVPLIRRAAKIFVLAIGAVYAANALDIEIGPMIASLGIGGLAFAFAAKDTIENFFGSVAVVLDRPFNVGDWVIMDDIEGTVESLGFRSTRIRTFYNSQITVPNANLVRANVDNMGRRKYRRWKTTIGVQYDTPPNKLIAFTEGIRELVRSHPYTRKDYYQVWMHDWSGSSMDVLLYIFFEVPDWNTELRERERMFVDIVRLADRLGVEFAFPTRTVHLYTEEKPAAGQPHSPTHAVPSGISDRRSMVDGMRAAQAVVKQQQWMNEVPPPQTYGQVGLTQLDDAGNETLVEETEKTEPTENHPERAAGRDDLAPDESEPDESDNNNDPAAEQKKQGSDGDGDG